MAHGRLLAACMAITLATSTARAGGFVIPDIGVRRNAMAAAIGRPDEGSAIYHNPAGMSLLPGWNLHVSFGLAVIRSEFQLQPWGDSNAYLGVEPGADGYYRTVRPSRAAGVVPMIAATGEIVPDRLWLGAGVYVGNAQGAAFDREAVTRYHLIEGYVVAPQAVLTAAYKVTPTLSLGASAGLMHLRIHGRRELYPIVDGTDIGNIAGTRAMLELDGQGWAPSWILAAFGRPHPRITWGATIHGRVDATLEGPVTVDYSSDAGNPDDSLAGTQRTSQLIPWAFMAGLNVDVHPNVEVGTELRYWLYRQYEEQRTEITGIFLVRELVTEKNYRDSINVAGGVRVHSLPVAPRLELMAGTHFDRTPAPANTLTFDQPSFNHLGGRIGARYRFDRFRLGVSYVRYWYFVPTVTGSTTTPPTNFKGDGANNIFTLSLDARL